MDVCFVIYYLSRLVSNQDNFPEDRNGQKSLLCLVSSRLEHKGNFPVRSCHEESFPKWKPALKKFPLCNSELISVGELTRQRKLSCPFLSWGKLFWWKPALIALRIDVVSVHVCPHLPFSFAFPTFEIPWQSISVCLSAFRSYKYQLYATLL